MKVPCGGEEGAVLGAPDLERADIVGGQALQQGQGPRTPHANLPHVGDIEHAGAFTHRAVLGEHSLVLNRHLVAGERPETGPRLDVTPVQDRPFHVVSLPEHPRPGMG